MIREKEKAETIQVLRQQPIQAPQVDYRAYPQNTVPLIIIKCVLSNLFELNRKITCISKF